MRPRSRQVSKRRLLLPTIREGTEETLRDLNEANALHIAAHSQPVSSEDYHLSICHLAHPTFPARDVSFESVQARQLDAAPHRLRQARHGGRTSTGPTEEAWSICDQQGEETTLSSGLMFGSSDPLEYLYGDHSSLSEGVRRVLVEGRQPGRRWEGQARSRAHSIPRASSPVLPRERKSSCPELHTSTDASAPSVPPTHTLSTSEGQRRTQAEGGAEGERNKPSMRQSLISQWLSDCRTAWRETRVRACMLPAIAEI